MSNKLKPCPFCGGEAKLRKRSVCFTQGVFMGEYYVECEKCGAQSVGKCGGYSTSEQQDIDFVVSRWNRRVADAE